MSNEAVKTFLKRFNITDVEAKERFVIWNSNRCGTEIRFSEPDAQLSDVEDIASQLWCVDKNGEDIDGREVNLDLSQDGEFFDSDDEGNKLQIRWTSNFATVVVLDKYNNEDYYTAGKESLYDFLHRYDSFDDADYAESDILAAILSLRFYEGLLD